MPTAQPQTQIGPRPARGLFEDLIPPSGRPPSSGLFDDLIPSTATKRPRIVEFEGRRIEVPDDATDDEIRGVLAERPSKAHTLPELEDALRNADAAGDTAAARVLADEIVRLRGVPPSQSAQPAASTRPIDTSFADHLFEHAAPTDSSVDAPLYVMQRADRGLADIAGAPVDLAAAALNAGLWGADKLANIFGAHLGTRIEKPFMGSDWIADKAAQGYEAGGGRIVSPEEVSPAVRIAGEATRFGTSAMGGSAALASAPAQAAAKAPSVVSRFLKPLAAPYVNSARAMWGDTAAGAGAGAAVQSYEDEAPQEVKDFVGPWGPAVATIVGGTAGSTAHAVAAGAKDLGKNLVRDAVKGRGDPAAPIYSATGKPFSRAEMDEAARAVQAQATNRHEAAGQIRDNVAQLSPDVRPHEMPTSGAISEDPGLVLLEREARARLPRPFVERDRATNARAGEIVRGVAPDGSRARDFTDTADSLQQSRVNAARVNLDASRSAEAAHAEDLRRKAADIASGAGQGTPASQRLDAEIVGGSLRPMQERKNASFAAIDPDRSVVRDATALIEAAGRIRDGLGRLNDPSSVLPVRTLDRIADLAPDAGGTGTITFGELNALRPELSSALTKAKAAGDYPLADNIRALQTAISRETERLAAEGTDAGRRAAEAQDIYRNEFAPVWNPGPGDEATRFRKDFNADRDARTQSPPSATAGRFLRPGQPEKAASLRRIIETLPDRTAATAEARRYLVSDMAESGIVDATGSQIRPDALRRWRNQWGGALDVVPGFRSEVDAMLAGAGEDALRSSELAKQVRAAEQRVDETVRNQGALGLALGRDPINAVSSIFGAGDPETAMAEVVKELGSNRRAKDGLKASVVEYLTSRVTQPALQKTADSSRPVDFGKLENLFARHERTLAEVFSPEEMNALRQAHRLLKPSAELKQGGGVPSRYENKQRDHAWMLLEGGLKARFGVLKGGGILRTIKIAVATLPNRDDAVRDILVRMQFDPELAIHLLGRHVEPSDPTWNAKLNRLLAIAAGSRTATAEAATSDEK